jgi:hypothetical protein
MRARVKRRDLYRRVTITVVVVATLVLLVGGIYYIYQSSNALAPGDDKPVTQADLATLTQESLPPYGPASSSMLTSGVLKDCTSSNCITPFTSHGKPLVVYIGADYCMYCAAQRWSLIIALMRFGNFTGLRYMSSSPADGDYPTFSFSNATYTSRYLVFQGFEQEDRNQKPLQTVPTNYSAVFLQYGGGYPFINFGDKYLLAGALYAPQNLEGRDWSNVLGQIKTNSTLGNDVKAAANVITALVCKLTGDQPMEVCNQSPIGSITILITAYAPGQVGLNSALIEFSPPADASSKVGTRLE